MDQPLEPSLTDKKRSPKGSPEHFYPDWTIAEWKNGIVALALYAYPEYRKTARNQSVSFAKDDELFKIITWTDYEASEKNPGEGIRYYHASLWTSNQDGHSTAEHVLQTTSKSDEGFMGVLKLMYKDVTMDLKNQIKASPPKHTNLY